MTAPDSAEQGFINEVLPFAQMGHAGTDLLVSVILAQWAIETGWGTSSAWLDGHNFAGVSPDGVIASYPNEGFGFDAWNATMLGPDYAAVRAAASEGYAAQAAALGASPWAASQYRVPGGAAGSALVDLITEYSLWQYDQPAAPAPQPQPEDEPMDPQLLVGLLYRVCLHRAPDEAGFLANVDALTSGKLTGAQVMANIQGSPEGIAVLAAERKALGLPA